MIDSRVVGFLPALLFITFAGNAGGRPTMAEVVAQTESAFSARCSEIGIRDSFLEYFATDAIHFDPEPRLTRPDLERETSSTKVRLTGEPRIVRVANTGQLAVSTGPYVLQTENGKDELPLASLVSTVIFNFLVGFSGSFNFVPPGPS